MFILGVDPGPAVGMALLGIEEPSGDGPVRLGTIATLQTTPGLLGAVLAGLTGHEPAVAVERFVVGSRAARSATAKAGAATRDTFAIVDDWRRRNGFPGWARSASDVKPWATDARLEAAGIDVPTGMRHAKDAARHALYCAVLTYGLPDPLSRRARSA